ncbi:GGDEF domain-containing protein [Pseudothauera rhizosphaerae]|uniref:diguanylate cyclase n=1 Tax=Pseudothauera rhizosphaerae TaxID=2565932 RepID=A0A4S4AZ11_9RHOO|nr:GGDEF domain-containing protein [Pseudothauera rhizosphaerae]
MRPHRSTLAALLLCANIGLLLYLAAGTPAGWAGIDWLDVVGEGGSALLTLVWLVMLLRSRPPGRVTRWLSGGLGCVFFSLWMDCLDEFVKLPDAVTWDKWLESGPMPVGLLLITVGLYHWHCEQRAISAQMEKRERLFREHRLFDKLTPLAGAEYLRRQLDLSLRQARAERRPLSLVALDIDDFDAVNRRFGHGEGDALLLALSHLLLLNLRHQDLLCRLAGDRFVVLLPDTGERVAQDIACELEAAVASFAYHTQGQDERLRLRARTAALMAVDEDAETLLRRLNLGLRDERRDTPPAA